MDTPSQRSNRRRYARRSDERYDEHSRRPQPRRTIAVAPPVVTVRPSTDRAHEPSSLSDISRMPPEEARAQIISLETQLEQMQQRLLENRLLDTQDDGERSRLRAEIHPRLRAALTALTATRAEASSPAGGVRLTTASNAEGSSPGSGTGGVAPTETEAQRRERTRAMLEGFVRDLPETSPPISGSIMRRVGRSITRRGPAGGIGPASPTVATTPSSSSTAPNAPSSSSTVAAAGGGAARPSASMLAATVAPPRPAPMPIASRPPRHRRGSSSTGLGETTSTSIRPIRGLWRLQDSSTDIDSELEDLHATAARRQAAEERYLRITAQRPMPADTENWSNNPRGAGERNTVERGYLPNLRDLMRQRWPDFAADSDDNAAAAAFGPTPFDRADTASRRPERRAAVPSTAVDRSTADPTLQPADAAGEPARASLAQQFDRLTQTANPTPNDYAEIQRAMRAHMAALQVATATAPRVPPVSLDKQKGRPDPLDPEDMKLDCECRICFTQLADTVLLPCSHLVICQWCADQIGAKTKDKVTRGGADVLCPMCRGAVKDRIRVYRG